MFWTLVGFNVVDHKPLLIDYMLRRQHKVDDQHHDMPLIYYMEGHNLYFGRQEFSLSTGFHFGTVSFDLHSSGELKFWNRVFPNKMGFSTTNLDIIRVIEDEEMFGKLSDDAIRLCLLLAVEEVIVNGDSVSSASAEAWNNIALIMRNKSDLDTLSMDDLYNNLKVYESEIKSQSSSSLNSQNIAFVSSDNSSSTNETFNTAHSVFASCSKDQASTASYAGDVMFSYFSNLSNALQLENEDLEQIDTDDRKEIDLKWNVAMLTMRVKRECMAPRNQGNRNRDAPTRNALVDTSTTNALVVQDGISGYDWSFQAEEELINFALMAYTSQGLSSTSSSDSEGEGYHAVPSPYTGNYMPSRADLSFDGLDISVFKSKVSETITSVPKIETNASKTSNDSLEKPKTIRSSAPLIEEWESDSEDENVFERKENTRVNHQNKLTHPHPKRNFIPAVVLTKSGKVPVNVAKQSSYRASTSVSAARRVNTAASRPNIYVVIIVRIVVIDYNDEMFSKRIVVIEQEKITGPKEIKPVWDNTARVNHQNKLTHPHPKRNFVPAVVLTKSGKEQVNVAKQSSCRAATSVSAARRVNTAASRPNAEAVNTACYVQNKVLVINPHNKTPYELFLGRKHALSFMRPFGCPVTILNTIDHLGNAGNQNNGNAGTKANINARQDRMKTVLGPQYVLLPLLTSYSQGLKSSEDKVVNDTRKKSTKVTRKENVVEAPEKECKNKMGLQKQKDKRGIKVRNKARLVAQGYTQEEGFDYDDVFAPVARIEAIRLFLAHASFMGFLVYQMDMKSVFLYVIIEEEAYVCQPLGFEDPHFLDKVYKVEKPYMVSIKLVKPEFKGLTHKKFQKSSMGELTFFLGLQVMQRDDGIFISQDKYVADILKKFDFSLVKTASTPIKTNKAFLRDQEAKDMDATAKVKNVNGKAQIQALVDKKKVIITEASIKRDLRFKDEGGVDCLSNEVIFEQLTLIGFVQVFLDNQVEGMDMHNAIFVISFHTKKVFTNMKREGKGFSGRVTPLFQFMIVQAPEDMGEGSKIPNDPYHIPILTQPSSSLPQKKQKSRRKQRKEIKVPSPSSKIPNEEGVPITSNDPLPSEKAKTAQAKEIACLKKRVKRLEQKRKSRTLELKRLRKVRTASRVESSTEASLVIEKEVSTADPVTTAGEVVTTAAKPKAITTAATIVTAVGTRPEEKWIVMQEPSETPSPKPMDSFQKPSQAKGKGSGKMVKPGNPLKRKDQIMIDEEVAKKLKAQIQAELEEEERLLRQKEEETNIALIES
nr:copia protein [Tanacetum cinerariifolium]